MKMNLFLLLLFILIFTGCGLFTDEPNLQSDYSIGDAGPAGGIIFYDNDADNESGNTDGLISDTAGWRYLEAAPGDLFQTNGNPEILQDENFRQQFKFGYHRIANSNENLYVNDSTVYSSSTCTKKTIGEGNNNTGLLVAAMGDRAYTQNAGTSDYYYVAKLSEGLVYGGYSDWFLPSLDELELLYAKKDIVGSFDTMSGTNYYWSSSEDPSSTTQAYFVHFDDGEAGSRERNVDGEVRSIRRFL